MFNLQFFGGGGAALGRGGAPSASGAASSTASFADNNPNVDSSNVVGKDFSSMRAMESALENNGYEVMNSTWIGSGNVAQGTIEFTDGNSSDGVLYEARVSQISGANPGALHVDSIRRFEEGEW